jgi:fructose-bisphosphate aldolase class II
MHYAVGAYSVNSLEQIVGLFQGACYSKTPLIVQISGKAHKYIGRGVLEAAIQAVSDNYPNVIYSLHLDHGDEETALYCIESGYYSSVMVDASMMSIKENIAITRRVVEHAKVFGISVEAELGRIGGKEDDISVAEKDTFLTNPESALEFVQKSGVDALAVAIGTSHGLNKFTQKQSLDLKRLKEIQNSLPGVPLVLHGASSISRDEIDRINAAGGKVDLSARGVPQEQYLEAALMGISKINIDTDTRLIWTRVYREYLRDNPEIVDFRMQGGIIINEISALFNHHSQLFGCLGKSNDFN